MDGIKLFINKIKLSLQKHTGVTQNKKSYESWLSKGYTNTPTVTVIIQSHNKSLQVSHIVAKLRAYPSIELIVIDDGSDFTHTRTLARLMTGANEFLIHSNDLYENIMYDRTLRMANGKYVALLQDDDDFDNLEWIQAAVRLFEQYPALAILGGKDALEFVFQSPKANGKIIQATRPFDFVPAVNRAPMWINRELYMQKLHHIDFAFAPFQYDDYELCARAWLNGLQVGWYDAGFKSLSAGGMRLWNQYFAQQQYEKNSRQLYSLYNKHQAEIERLVQQSHRLFLQKSKD